MQILNIFHVLIAIALVGLVLIQKGQGATAGASFGAGASATVFGARGAGTFLTRATWVLAGLFCAISLTMAVVVSRTVGVPDSDLGVVADTAVREAPAEEADNLPPGETLSVADDEQNATDLPAIEPVGVTESDVPEFAPPEGGGAIEGSEVRDDVAPQGAWQGENAEDEGTDSGR